MFKYVLSAVLCVIYFVDGKQLPNGFFLDIDGISMAPGNSHICALESKPGLEIGGSPKCWGTDVDSKLKAPSDTFVQIVCGLKYACGVTLDQRIKCWGDGIPSEVDGLYSQISSGTTFVCGVMTDGHINCWGSSLTAHNLPADAKYVQVSCGNSHCCALDDEGLVQCWGTKRSPDLAPPQVFMKIGSEGELIFAPEDELPDPSVVDSEELEDFTNNPYFVSSQIQFKQISVGDGTACGIQYLDNRVRCWGNTKRYKLAEDSILEGSFRQVSVGAGGVCAIESDTNQLQCFGLAQKRMGSRVTDFEWDQIRVGKYNVCGVTMESQLMCAGVSNYQSEIPEGFSVA